MIQDSTEHPGGLNAAVCALYFVLCALSVVSGQSSLIRIGPIKIYRTYATDY